MLKFKTFIGAKVNETHDPKHVKQAIGIASDPRYAKGNMTGAVKAMNKLSKDIDKHPQVAAVLKRQNEAKVNELSKSTLGGYIKKASRDVFQKGRDDATQDAISKLGGKHKDQEYKKGPERKAAKRVGGIDRATKRLMQKGKNVSGLRNNENVKTEAMSAADQKAHDDAVAAWKAKGGKIKKLKPGYAQGWHGKSDPGAGIKGMLAKDSAKKLGLKKHGKHLDTSTPVHKEEGKKWKK